MVRSSTTLDRELEEPIRAELFGIERLEQHAESLAAAQIITGDVRRGRLLTPRVLENGRVLVESYRTIARAIREEKTITPAAEWLVDNFHIVDEQLREIIDDLPPGYYRQLPKLASGHLQDYPRVFGVAWAFVAHTDSRFDPDMIDPAAATQNFARLTEAGGRGPYGFYEALDYTGTRVPEGKDVAIVRAYMSHHQGMSLVAIANVLNDGVMRSRFHAEPMVRATELLLQERTPRDVPVARPRAEEVSAAAQIRDLIPPVLRRFTSPHAGCGGWTWYSGSAGWLYRAGVEWMLGFRLRGSTLCIDPCIPRHWPGYSIRFRYHSALYDITVENPRNATRGVTVAELDGVSLIGRDNIPLVAAGKHHIRIVLG